MVDKKILCVDDEETIRYFLSAALSDKGYAVDTAHDGQHALDIWRPDISLLITDIKMPRMNGFDLVERLRKDHPHLPIIMLTGYNDYEQRALEYGVDEFITKPFDLNLLYSSVRRLLN